MLRARILSMNSLPNIGNLRRLFRGLLSLKLFLVGNKMFREFKVFVFKIQGVTSSKSVRDVKTKVDDFVQERARR